MDLVLELLEDPAYRHVLLNHLPVSGLAVAWLVLGFSVFERRWSTMVFALSLVLITSASANPVMSAGDDAYPFVFDSLDGVGRDWLDHHVLIAERWGRLHLVNAFVAGAAIGLGFYRSRWRIGVGVVVLVSTLAALAASAVIAGGGGKVRHPEFRLEDPPIHETPGRLRRS